MRKHLQKFTPLLLGLIVLGLFSFAPEVLAQDDLIDQTAFEAFAEEAGFAAGVDIRVIIARLIR